MSHEKRSLSDFEIRQLAHRFESRSVEELLEWAAACFSPRLVMTSSFGAEGIVLLHKLTRLVPDIPVIYLDTGFHFQETEQLKEQVRARFNLNLIEQHAALTVEQQAQLYGDKLYARDPERCCRLRKVEPLREALSGYDAWLAALRRDQSPTRARIGLIEWNARHEMIKLNPLAAWTRADVWNYLLKHDLPYNPLYDEGYLSIGCAPCTRRVTAGAHERSGRWDGVTRLECGIHL
jgi:phosphoadenosine phosphosulfate reductase